MINMLVSTIRDRFLYIIGTTLLIMIFIDPDSTLERNMFWILMYTVLSSNPGRLSVGYFSTLPIEMKNIIYQKLIETLVIITIYMTVAMIQDVAFTDQIILIYMLEILLSSMYFKLNVGKNSLQKKYWFLDLAAIVAVWFLFTLAPSINLKILVLLIPTAGVVYRLKTLPKLDFE